MPYVSPAMAAGVARFKREQARSSRPAAGFANQLAAARGKPVARTMPVGTVKATTPLGGLRDDWAHRRVNVPRVRPAVAPRVTKPLTRSTELASYPRPARDNGRGLHWIPTTGSPPEAVDRFVDEAKAMHARWVVFLNAGADVGQNDHLVRRLTAAGIEPVMRIYTPGIGPVPGDVDAMVRHYKALGVDYYQILNEPNVRDENGGAVPSVDRYLDAWIPAARKVIAGGGLPGFGALSPAGDVDDVRFLRDALDGLKARDALDTLDRGWLAAHNYTLGRPIQDENGFLKFRWYDEVIRAKLGRSLPIIGTEGGTTVGDRNADVSAMKYMEQPHEPYFFANTLWVIANKAGGGHDPQWEQHALIRPDGASAVVDALRKLA